jgi:phosphoglycerate dehydrogenase-like enzyme
LNKYLDLKILTKLEALKVIMATGKVIVLTRGVMEQKMLDQFNPFIPDGWQVTFIDNSEEDESNIIATLVDAEYIVTLGARPIPVRFVENSKKLKLLQHHGQDVGHFPLQWAFDKGIPVANAGGANAIAVSEFTVLLILSCLRQIEKASKNIREGKWRNYSDRDTQMQLYDKTVGIIGFGNIGRRVAKLCYGFGANIIYYEKLFVPHSLRADMKARSVSFSELLKYSDIVSLHIPSDPGSPALIGWEQLCLMKQSAYLINTSRGANIDESALIRALSEKIIAGAALDVWNPEPPNPDNPLLKMTNVVSTPHMAGSALENVIPALEAVWRNILLVSEGKDPLNRIHP